MAIFTSEQSNANAEYLRRLLRQRQPEFSRKPKSSSTDRPRSPTRSVFWSSETTVPCWVVIDQAVERLPGQRRVQFMSRDGLIAFLQQVTLEHSVFTVVPHR